MFNIYRILIKHARLFTKRQQLQAPGTKRKYLSNGENAEEEKYSVIGIMMMMM